jgi:hypothetical protein
MMPLPFVRSPRDGEFPAILPDLATFRSTDFAASDQGMVARAKRNRFELA